MFQKMIQEIEEKNLNVHALEIVKNGKVVLSCGFNGCSADERHPIYSATKAFTSTAVGIAGDEGRLSDDALLYEFLESKYLRCIPDDRLADFKKLTFSRFLTMSIPGYPFRPEGNDWLEFALSLPVDYGAPPVFSYSNISAYLVGAACENAVGQPLAKYLAPRLFEPLGIEKPVYKTSPEGHFYGASGMELNVCELGMLGRLYLQNGIVGGERILSERWIKKAASARISNREGGYGYFIWTAGNGFRISGKWGQKCLVYPERSLIITYLSDMPENAGEMLETAERYAMEI